MSETVLYDYWRSSASYRVRIALNSLGESYRSVPVDLLAKAHKAPEHLVRNPQGLVPVLEIDGERFTQSLAIIEYLAETRATSGFLPEDAIGRQRVRSLSYAIAMDIHPVCNLSVVSHVMANAEDSEAARRNWMRKFIGEGLSAFERLLDHSATGRFCHGDMPTMADFCLVPQVYNARRWDVDLSACPRLVAIDQNCAEIEAFARAHPDRTPR
ncbi:MULTISPECIES: maleylacetoacetate isomerase [Ensifer]|uniref:maleylacetoacetate isomerase n=1 Tax=Ensifer TaxID=106591 RepID=UPI00071323AC|nr:MULTISPECIES: maleylacetoacetate isomerase [Ensifer]KQX57560.1 maleylacetoacetate isomerase [Ensifer sp. Root1298]KQX92722.1 maleylacetoacetate isomerase [Ensifer sp. Root1312]KRC28489.1 maleylacetoacetate isomerase [Ensifer sp. Root74]KRD78629.1 maleylacetoacetate isomerase [Ensifer sp. Root954]MBW0370248.1 maleylacetoacetate isomerase [Ensifer adhaerens]